MSISTVAPWHRSESCSPQRPLCSLSTSQSAALFPTTTRNRRNDDKVHYDDTVPHLPPTSPCCEQWHLTPDITGVTKKKAGMVDPDSNGDPVIQVPGLWQGWDADNPVTVAVLDTGVDVLGIPISQNQLASGSPGGCHSKDS